MKSVKLLFSFVSLSLLLFTLNSCRNASTEFKHLPEVPTGAQAVSLGGQPLFPADPSPAITENYEKSKQADLSIPENLIWYGRWTAYKGDYREAILIFSEGIDQFPEDARFYRHRGHRYITIREFDRAIADFEKAAELMQDKPDETEPDGMPNDLNIPVSTLKSNIYYHLGLAYYLKKQLPEAEKAFRDCIGLQTNEDNLVSATHWLYMILKLQGKNQEAWKAVESIHPEMNVIENMAYHQLCLLYKGQKNISDFVSREYSGIMNDAIAYGIGNFYKYNGNLKKAEEVFSHILNGSNWASFGYIAAEAEQYTETQ
jgi:tetratricopeptide (TPR) repeat protein